jgi:hypothetical protein
MLGMRVFGTPVTIAKKALIWPFVIWAGTTWWGLRRNPECGLGRGTLAGLVAMLVLLSVELGHAFAHIFSARYAGAPMDELRVSGGMPRTLYWNSDVPPVVHRLRAVGGPLYNLLGLALSSTTYNLAPPLSFARELAAYAAGGHGLQLFMSLLPLPMVDGGTLVKWTLVAHGRAEREADEVLQRLDAAMAVASSLSGALLVASRRRRAGSILAGCGVLLAAVAAGKIR